MVICDECCKKLYRNYWPLKLKARVCQECSRFRECAEIPDSTLQPVDGSDS